MVIHDECAAKMDDVAVLKEILAPHRNGTPGVNLHCAMHSYRVGDHRTPTKTGTEASLWFDYLGIQSSGHGPKEPIAISFTNTKHPVTKVLKDWATGNEELYNNVQILPGAKALATGFQHQKERVSAKGSSFLLKMLKPLSFGPTTTTIAGYSAPRLAIMTKPSPMIAILILSPAGFSGP